MRQSDVLSDSSTYHCCSVSDYCNVSGEGCEDFAAMAAFDAKKLETEEERDRFPSITENLCMEEKDDDRDFSFVCLNANESPISADEVFQNGQIRPIFPIFNRNVLFSDSSGCDRESKEMAHLRPPLRKLFVKESAAVSSSSVSSSSASESDELEGLDAGTYCEWSPKVFKVSPELGKKSNSTGSCKLWRFRNLVNRSKSDGKDAFVFLNNPAPTKSSKAKRDPAIKTPYTEQMKKSVKAKVKKGGESQTASSAHERHYVRNRAKKEEDKRRSYLPYRQDLIGFFTSVNGFSRNIHPF